MGEYWWYENRYAVMEYAPTLIDYEKFNGENSHALEFGVATGDTTRRIRSKIKPEIPIYGFDSFYGLPADWEKTPCNKGYFSTNGVAPEIEGVEFFKGWFSETLPLYLKIAKDICFLHIDCDLYESTKEVFESLNHLIVPQTIILFDEYFYANTGRTQYFSDHEAKAFKEWVEKYDRKYEELPLNPNGETYVDCEQKIMRIL